MDIGVDIVEIDRIARSVKNPRFLKRVFTASEVAYCRARKNSAQHFAVRFAAKEAVWKAVGQPRLLHRDIQVRQRKARGDLPEAFYKIGASGLHLPFPWPRLRRRDGDL